MRARRIDPDTIRAIPDDRIFFVQLADAPAIDMDLLYWSRHFRNMPGEGDLDVTGFMRAVAATGYGGPLSLEIFNDQFRAGLPRMVAQDGHRSLIALMDAVHRAEPARAAAPALPPPAPVRRVEFIEFASNPQEASALAALLDSAGFSQAGRHVSKPVTLWRQGGANVLINAGEAGFTHSAYLTHGTTVSEIALGRAVLPALQPAARTASSSRSSSARATTKATAPPTPPSASPPRSAPHDPRGCQGARAADRLAGPLDRHATRPRPLRAR